MRLVTLKNYMGQPRILAGWETTTGAEDGWEVVDAVTGELVRYVGIAANAVLPFAANAPTVAGDGRIYSAKYVRESGLPHLADGPPKGPVLALLDASVVGTPAPGFRWTWNPLLGDPQLRPMQMPGDEHTPPSTLEGRVMFPAGGGETEVAVISFAEWEAVELLELAIPRPEVTLGDALGVDVPEIDPRHRRRVGAVIMEGHRRLRWVPASHWTEWRQHAPAASRERLDFKDSLLTM